MKNENKKDYVIQMRKSFSNKNSILSNGDLNHKYFQTKIGQYWTAEDNELLKHVIADYEDLYKKLQAQKENQQEQMKRILEHLQDIRERNFLSDTGLRHIEHEQNELLTKLKGVQESVHALAK